MGIVKSIKRGMEFLVAIVSVLGKNEILAAVRESRRSLFTERTGTLLSGPHPPGYRQNCPGAVSGAFSGAVTHIPHLASFPSGLEWSQQQSEL